MASIACLDPEPVSSLFDISNLFNIEIDLNPTRYICTTLKNILNLKDIFLKSNDDFNKFVRFL